MGRPSKRTREIAKQHGCLKNIQVNEAIDILKKCPPVKFDQSVDISLKIGVDPRRSDQHVRGTVSLPNGTGKIDRYPRLCTEAKKLKKPWMLALIMRATMNYLKKSTAGWTGFDAVIATPDMMRDVGKLGKVLGPRGLMPTPKAGTVTTDVAKAINELKAGKIEFKLDRHGMINVAVGKISFASGKIGPKYCCLFTGSC